jgi:hypothetical protein
VGFGIAASIDIVNGLNVFYPLLPKIPVASIMNLREFFPARPWSDMGDFIVCFYPFAIGMFFFMPTDLAFSFWFFFLFFKAERLLTSHFGWQIPGAPFVNEQMAGGFYAIAILAIFMTRRQILRMLRILAGGHIKGETRWDRQEAWMAVFLIAGGSAFLMYFCVRAGMTPWVSAGFLLMFFLISIAITRMRVEVGPPVHDLHSAGPNTQILNMLGMTAMRKRNPVDMAMFGLLNFFNRVYRGHPMPHGMEAFRVAHMFKMGNFRYFLAMGIAVFAGTFFSFWALLWMFYKYGCTAEMVAADWFGWEIWGRVNQWFTAPQPYRLDSTVAMVVGLLFCLGLSALRLNLPWCPFHPVGFALAGTWSMDRFWLCVLVAWTAKVIVLRFGGADAYRRVVPFFVGLILGDFLLGAFWNLYGIVFECHVYRFWY